MDEPKCAPADFEDKHTAYEVKACQSARGFFSEPVTLRLRRKIK